MASEEIFNDILSSASAQYDLNLIDEIFAQKNQQESRTTKLLKSVKEYYATNLFCDIKLVAGHVDLGFNSIACHSMVIVSCLPSLKLLFESALQLGTDDDFARIYLPEFSFDELKIFMDNIYNALECNADVFIGHSLLQTLGLKTQNDSNLVILPSTDLQVEVTNEVIVEKDDVKEPENVQNEPPVEEKRRSVRKRKHLIENTDNNSLDFAQEALDDVPYEPFESEQVEQKPAVSKKRGRPAKGNHCEGHSIPCDPEIKEINQRKIEDIVKEQSNGLHQILPFNWTLTEPSLFSNAIEYRELLERCADAGTVVHAKTGRPFEFTSEDASAWDDKYTNKVKKLIRIPNETISTIVAVGVRSGINIIQPVAMTNWPVSANFENLLEMLLNIAGTSKAQFFGHERYYKFKKISSKPNRVGRALQAIKKLSDEDRESLRIETMKQIGEMEAVRIKHIFSHLPVISVK